jgi:hypothetical protein
MSGLVFRRFQTGRPGGVSRRRAILGTAAREGKRIPGLKPGSKSFCINQ